MTPIRKEIKDTQWIPGETLNGEVKEMMKR